MWDKEPTASSPPSPGWPPRRCRKMGDVSFTCPKEHSPGSFYRPKQQSNLHCYFLPSTVPLSNCSWGREGEGCPQIPHQQWPPDTRRERHGLGPSSSPNHLTPTLCSSCFPGPCPAPLRLTLLTFNPPKTLLWSCYSLLPVSPWSTENEFKCNGCMECILAPISFCSSTLYFSSINPHLQPNGSQYLCLLHFPDGTSATYPIPT